VDDRQFEKFLEGVKASVTMKERVLCTEAEGSNQAVDRLPYCVIPAPKGPTVSCRLACRHHAACVEDFQVQQSPLNLLRHNVVADALQYFAEDDIGQPKALVEFRVQPTPLRCVAY
jgi:hypothetical protein